MQRILIRAFIVSFLCIVAQQLTDGLLSWHALPPIAMPLVILIFMIALGSDIRLVMTIACVTGFLLDLWSTHAMGTLMFSLVLTISVTYAIFHRIFTNKSLGSLLFLGILGTLIYRVSLFLISLLGFLQNPMLLSGVLSDTLMRTSIEIVGHSIVLTIFFIVTRAFTKHLHTHYVPLS